MNRNRREIILETLFHIHKKLRSKKANTTVSDHTKSAVEITNKWQSELEKNLTGICSEKEIYQDSNEKIDLIDLIENTAYELKVSGKNPHHEFYKDIFKILIYNEESTNEKIKTFVFITEKKGIKLLEERSKRAIILTKARHNLNIEFESI